MEEITEQVEAIVDEAEPVELPMRMASVLRVLYLVFNEGYSPSSGAAVTRADLSRQAIRLTRLIVNLMTTTHTMAEIYGCLLSCYSTSPVVQHARTVRVIWFR